jgi:GT2 family glycosyltransferase
MMDLSKIITIGITTKDRWEELVQTIDKLVALGLDGLPTIVVDDGSAETRAEEVCRPLKNCTVLHEPVSLGLVEERNRIAQLAKTDYLVSLDDDSCFEAPHNLDKAVEYMDANPDVAVLAFWITRTHAKPGRRMTADGGKPPLPVPVREYNGCGHMLRMATFRELGGYRGYFHHMCEERDYSLRVYGSGRRVVLFPNVEVLHRLTPVARSSRRVSFYAARNTLLCWSLNLPLPTCVWRSARSALGQVFAVLQRRQRCWPTIKGLAASLSVFWRHRYDRRPLPPSLLREYFSL